MTNRTDSVNSNNPAQKQPENNFYGLGIAPKILDILEKIKFKVPTPIQLKAIPLAIQGKDIIGIAQTGTGKTHSFAIPMVQRLAQAKGTGLVLAPTRELALQIEETFKGLTHAFGMTTACLIGGAPMHSQTQALRKKPRVIIATPGRLFDHMNQRNVSLSDVCWCLTKPTACWIWVLPRKLKKFCVLCQKKGKQCFSRLLCPKKSWLWPPGI